MSSPRRRKRLGKTKSQSLPCTTLPPGPETPRRRGGQHAVSPHPPGQQDKRTDRAGERGRIQNSCRCQSRSDAVQPAAESRHPASPRARTGGSSDGAKGHGKKPEVGCVESSPQCACWATTPSPDTTPAAPGADAAAHRPRAVAGKEAEGQAGRAVLGGSVGGLEEHGPRGSDPLSGLTSQRGQAGSKGPLPVGGEQKTRERLSAYSQIQGTSESVSK